MAGPERPTLSAAATRALPAIEGGVARGLSANALSRTLQEAGLGLRRTDLLEAVRYVQGKAAAADRLKYVRQDYAPDPARLQPALHPDIMRRAFAYTVEVRGDGPGFDEEGRLFVNVSSSTSLSRADIEAEAEASVIEGEDERYAQANVTGYVLVSAIRR